MTESKNSSFPAQLRIGNPLELFNKIYLALLWLNMCRIRIVFGGASSGKSKYLADEKVLGTFEGRNCLVCRKVANTLRGSVWKELLDSITRLELGYYFNINKSSFEITHKATGAQLVCTGLDDREKLKSIRPAKGVWHDVWMEEATEFDKDDMVQLFIRQRGRCKFKKRLDMSFNPIIRTHWIVSEYFDYAKWSDNQTYYEHPKKRFSILRTTYKHNKFLTNEDRRNIESLKDISPYHYMVYGLGMWGTLGDVIYSNWRIEAFDESKFCNYKNGLDWGFSSDPFALVRTNLDRNHRTIYVCDELYEKGLTNNKSAPLVMDMIGQELVVCDSAEPKSIEDYINMGVNAVGAKKGKGSIEHGIRKLQSYTIIIHPRCVNFINEIQQYQWKKNKDGDSLATPIDKFNHLIDGLRYAYEEDILPLTAKNVHTGKTVINYVEDYL